MLYHMGYPFKSMKGFMAYSYFVNEGAANYVILRHEFSHREIRRGDQNIHVLCRGLCHAKLMGQVLTGI